MNFKIRAFESTDQPHLDRIRRLQLTASIPRQRLAELTQSQQIERMENWYNEKVVFLQNVPISRTYVAVDEQDQPIGYVIVIAEAKDDFRPERQGFLCDLAVEEDYCGEAVATALIQAAEDYVKRMGHEFMMLNVSSYNQRAINFYHKLGYSNEWIMMGKRLPLENTPKNLDEELN